MRQWRTKKDDLFTETILFACQKICNVCRTEKDFYPQRRRVRRGGARSTRPAGETVRSKPNEQGRSSSEVQTNEHCELLGKRIFSQGSLRPGEKIATLHPMRPENRRFLAAGGEGGSEVGTNEGRRLWRMQAAESPISKGAERACDDLRLLRIGLLPRPLGCQKICNVYAFHKASL